MGVKWYRGLEVYHMEQNVSLAYVCWALCYECSYETPCRLSLFSCFNFLIKNACVGGSFMKLRDCFMCLPPPPPLKASRQVICVAG
jgi:hypothetical protein